MATTYDDILKILELSHTKRTITVQSTLESQGLTPKNRTSPMNVKNTSNETILPTPPRHSSDNFDESVRKSSGKKNLMQLSPFQNALHSMSSREESFIQTSPIRNRTMLAEAIEGPIDVPLRNETKTSSFIDNISKSTDTLFSIQDTTKSSNKSTTTQSRQSFEHQFLPSDEIAGAPESETSQPSNDTAISRIHGMRNEDEDTENKQINSSRFLLTEQQERPENSLIGDYDTIDFTTSEIKPQHSLFEDSIARANYEQRLQIARREHSKAERELKELYVHTCETNESKIRELQVDRDVLQHVLEESKIERTLLADTRIKELEKQVAEAERVRIQLQVEAGEKIRTKTIEYSRLATAKENRWMEKVDALEEENCKLREASESRLVELNMSRTMMSEMESRILATERERDEVTNRLEEAFGSIQKLEDSICRVEKEGDTKKRDLEQAQEKLDKILKENGAMIQQIENYESFKEKTSILTKKLANSVGEKQKALLESQSITSKLEAENDDLTKQIEDSTSDVEQLVQEKLLLEDKLAQTWKDIEKTKNDASTIHETLLEKLENGQYYTSADIDEKENIIQALESRVKSLRRNSEEKLLTSNKTTVLLQLQLREALRKLRKTELSNVKTEQERDSWHKKSIEHELTLADTKDQVSKITEMYRNEMASVNELKAQLEAVSTSKSKSDTIYEKSIESLSLQLQSKESELLSCERRLDGMESLKNGAIARRDELEAEVQGVKKAKEETSLEYQKSIESLSLQLESKRSELSSCEGRLAEMVSLRKKEEISATKLEAELEAMARSKKEAHSHYQKSIELISSELKSKSKEFSDDANLLKTTEKELKEKIILLQDEKEDLAVKYEDQIEALEAEIRQSTEKIEALTDSLQSQQMDLSCLEMRSQILEDDTNALKSAHAKAQEKVDTITKEKNDVECRQEAVIQRLTLDLQSKQSLLETKESDLTRSIDSLASKNVEARNQYQKDIEELTKELETIRNQFSNAAAKLKHFEDLGISVDTIEELRTTIKYLKSESESVSTQYWESIQEVTSELHAKTEKMSSKQAILEDLEVEIESSKIKIQELEHDIFQKDILVGDMRTKIASQTKRLDSYKSEKAGKVKLICSLQSRINDLEQETKGKRELQNSSDDLKKTVEDLRTSKERMSIKLCSEIFRLVKRVAILDHTHSDVNKQRMKAMEIAILQRKWQAQAKLHVEKLERKLQSTSGIVVQLENKLKRTQNIQKEKENQVASELVEKTKQLKHQNVMTSSLQVEISAMIRLNQHLQDSKEREVSELKEENGNLQSELSSEKLSRARADNDAYDARMELKMLDTKYSSMLSNKDDAILKSENSRATIARSLLHANAVVASLRVKLKEKDCDIVANDSIEKSAEKIDLLHQTVCKLQGNLEGQDEVVRKLKEEVEHSRATSYGLKEDMKRTEGDCQDQVEVLQQQILSTKATLTANHNQISSLGKIVKDLNDQLLSLQDARGKDRICSQVTEQKLKRRILMLRAHYVSKHLKEQILEKDISNLHRAESANKKTIDDLQETNDRTHRELERMREDISDNEHQYERLQQVLQVVFDKNLLSEEGYSEEIDGSEKSRSKDKKIRLLKNIEYLSSKLISLEESMKQSKIFYRDSEESLKKSVSKLRAEYVAKHLETNELKKKVAVLRQGKTFSKKNTDDLQSKISLLQAELENKNIALFKNETRCNELGQKISLVENERTKYQEKMDSLLQSKDNEMVLLNDQLLQSKSQANALKSHMKSFEENNELEKKEVESKLVQKEMELEKLHEKIILLQNEVSTDQKKLREEESNRKSDAETISVLRGEAQRLSSRLEILDKEKCAMTDTISRQEERLKAEEEKFNQEIACEMTRLREKVGKLEAENFAKSSSLAELSSTSESIRDRFRNLLGQKNDLEGRLVSANDELTRYREEFNERRKDLVESDNTRAVLERDLKALSEQLDTERRLRRKEASALGDENSKLEVMKDTLYKHIEYAKNIEIQLDEERESHLALQEKLNNNKTLGSEHQNHVSQLQNEIISLRELLMKKEDSMSTLKSELHELKDQETDAESRIESPRTNPPVLETEMSAHMSCVKEAFNVQAAVLEDVKLSESMLETLINEVMSLANQSESEMLELSSVLGTVDELLLNPSNLLSSLDLAGLESSQRYFGEVRSRLEDLAALAYNTSVELNNRQNQLTQWRSNRAESPVLPATPPASKQVKRTLFGVEDVKSSRDATPVITDGAKEVRDKVAGARLLCCILENNNKIKLASAFRKWTCAAGAINANVNASNHKVTAVELAHELEITREKLMTLKSHLKKGRLGKQKPRLRRILERLDGNVPNRGDDMNSKTNMNSMNQVNMDNASMANNQNSFEL